MHGVVFDIQNYAIYDGPGIRTLVFFKGCPLRCAWCHNPESWRREPELAHFAERCEACGVCVETCPNNALQLRDGILEREASRCTVCGACAEACPTGATEIIGREMDVAAIRETVLRDKPFYDTSGGGVTFTGGEAVMQPEFLLAVARSVREAGIHVALETCGYFDASWVAPLAENVDLILFDLKLVAAETHRRWTGADPERIHDRFRELLEVVGTDRLVVRMPLIPGVNTGDDDLDALIDFLRDAGYTGPVHLMPYNRLARTKWEKVGRGGDYRDFGELAESDRQRAVRHLEAAGFSVEVNE
ncbi:MAG: glycyl-radical enzyme activating protein [Candidatus Lernaella stagnicola]|nr:glycyl-radical enzyme activating protein [Candidatus Lernaella stagnicola]